MPHEPTPTSRTFISQRLRLHYVDWGNDGAPPLILVHGGLDHCRSWDWVARRLSPRWHVIAPDLRGHGDSETPRNFNIAPGGEYLLAANQNGDNVVVFKLNPDTGELTPTGRQITIDAPVCIVYHPVA